MDAFSIDARGSQRGLDFLAVCAGALDHFLKDAGINKETVTTREAPGDHPAGYANFLRLTCGPDWHMSLRLDGNTVHYESSVLLPGLRDALRYAATL